MSGGPLSERDRRALRLGAMALAPALVWFLLAAPYLRAVREADRRLAAQRVLLRQELSLLAAATTYPDSFRDGASRLLAVMPRLFRPPNDDGVAGAEVTGYIGRLARESRVFVARIEPMRAEAAETGVLRLPVRVGGEGDLEGLLTFLRSLRAGEKLVHVTALRIDSPEARSRADGAEVLAFEFTAAGFALSRPEREPGAGTGARAEAGP